MSDREIIKALADSLAIANEQAKHFKDQCDHLLQALGSQSGALASGVTSAFEMAAREAENGGFIEARDSEWDDGVNFARKFIAARIRALANNPTPANGEAE